MMTLLVTVSLLARAAVGFGDDSAPKPLPDNKPCVYPPAAQKLYVAGPVHFVAQVRPDGTTESVESLDDAAVEAVRQWRYAPTMLDGKAIPITITVPVTFIPSTGGPVQ